MKSKTCACPMWNSGDARGCLEVHEYGSTPRVQPGDVLDGVIVVEDDGTIMAGYPSPEDECECLCHED